MQSAAKAESAALASLSIGVMWLAGNGNGVMA
jgi:hypothetical protein